MAEDSIPIPEEWPELLHKVLEGFAAFLGKLRQFVWEILCVALASCATFPFFRTEFSFFDLLLARLFLAAAMMVATELIARHVVSRFSLGEFRIDVGLPGRKIVRISRLSPLIAIGVFLLSVFLDPIGTFASGHSKALVSAFYITDRQPDLGGAGFSSEPSSPETVTYGSAIVPISWRQSDIIHNLGSPAFLSWSRTTVSLRETAERYFYEDLEEAIRASEKHEAFVFVHGFNNSFDDALRSTAILSYDFRFQTPKVFRGVSVLFSWPASKNAVPTPMSYTHDADKAGWSVEHLKRVLLRLARVGATDRLHLIAHSMGSTVLVEAIQSLQGSKVTSARFRNLILAAPDVYAPRFGQAYPEIEMFAGRTTVYVSGRDLALRASSMLHTETRVGLRLQCRDGMDVIDTEGQDTSIRDFYHGYLFDSQLILDDLRGIFAGLPPAARGLEQANDQCFWVFEHR